MVHNVAQPDLEAIMEYLLDAEVNVDYRLGWTWISHEEVSWLRILLAGGEGTDRVACVGYTPSRHGTLLVRW